MKPKIKLTWSLVLVILALILATTVAYALYRYFTDPGLQNANDAGLVTDLNDTAQSTRVIGTPIWGVPNPVMQIGETQTQDGMTITLNWIYVEDSHQAIGFTATGIADGLRLGLPTVTYAGVTPEEFSGATMQLDGAGNGMLVTYQIVREGVVDSKVNVSIDIPVMREEEIISTFHFDIIDAPMDAIGGGGGSTYAVRVNGVALRQEYIIVTSAYTEARLCYPAISTDDWQLQEITLQFLDEVGEPLQGAAPMNGARLASDKDQERCAIVTFRLGNTEGTTSRITVGSIGAGAEYIDGGWQFYTGLSNLVQAEGATLAISTPQAPLAEETIGDLKATLDWAYADANRVAFQIHFDGWEENYFINGVSMLTADGMEINSSLGYQPAGDDPSRFTLDFEPVNGLGAGRFNGELVVMVSNDPVNYNSFAEYHFELDLPVYPATILEPMQEVSANGVEMLLQRVKITSSFTYVYLCYNKPTTGDFSDWQVGFQGDGPILKIGADEASINTAMMIFDSEIGDVGKGPEPGWVSPIKIGRCLKIGFPVGHHDQPETLTLTVPALEKSTPEVIPDEDIKHAQEILRAQGIEMIYTTVTGNGGGGAGMRFTKKPDGMTDTEAYQKFIDALGYVHAGPWVFEVEVKP